MISFIYTKYHFFFNSTLFTKLIFSNFENFKLDKLANELDKNRKISLKLIKLFLK